MITESYPQTVKANIQGPDFWVMVSVLVRAALTNQV